MIPAPWVAAVLALGVLRLTRLVGWDDFPPIAKARGWITGEQVTSRGSSNALMGVAGEQIIVEHRYRRPTLQKLLECPFCAGWWISAATYVAWYYEPYWTVTVLAPFALSMTVGLAAKWLDP